MTATDSYRRPATKRLSSPDTVTVLRALGGAVMTKRIGRRPGGGLNIQPYDRGFEFAVTEVQVGGIIQLGRLPRVRGG
jgi:hypothetical protein